MTGPRASSTGIRRRPSSRPTRPRTGTSSRSKIPALAGTRSAGSPRDLEEDLRLQSYLLFIDKLNAWVGKFFSWFLLALVLMTSYDVFARYILREPLGWAFDMSYYLYAIVFMMGGAYALSRNQHVRGDIFYRTWPVKVQAAVELALMVIAFFPGMIAFVSSGLQYAIPAMQIGERTQTSFVQLPLWPLKMVIPLAGVFMVLAGVVETVRAITALRTGTWPERLADVEEIEEGLLAKQEQL